MIKRSVLAGTIMVLLSCTTQVEAKTPLSVSLYLGATVPTNTGLVRLTKWGHTSVGVGLEYGARKPWLLGFELSQIPLTGKKIYTYVQVSPVTWRYTSFSSDWTWTQGIIYARWLPYPRKFTPYLKFGTGLYHLKAKYVCLGSTVESSKSSWGISPGFGLQLDLGRMPISLYGEFEYNVIFARILVPFILYRLESSQIGNAKIGLRWSF